MGSLDTTANPHGARVAGTETQGLRPALENSSTTLHARAVQEILSIRSHRFCRQFIQQKHRPALAPSPERGR